MKASLPVYFEDPFWVGVFERIEDGKLSVCKVTFGAEPKDYEVWDYVLHHYYELLFSPAIEIETRQAADNPKEGSEMPESIWRTPVSVRSPSRRCKDSGRK